MHRSDAVEHRLMPTPPLRTARIILPSNLPFARWCGVFDGPTVAPAMIYRVAHQAEVLTLIGKSYRLKDTKPTLPSDRTESKAHWVEGNMLRQFSRRKRTALSDR